MRKLLFALCFTLWPLVAFGQCTGIFPNNSYCGNTSGSPAPPTFNSLQSTFVAGPVASTNLGLPLWANTTGTVLQDGSGKTIAGAYTWGGANNFTSTFQIGGTTQAFPASGALVGTTDIQTLTNKTLTSPTINGATFSGSLAGTANFTGTFQSGGFTQTFPGAAATLAATNIAQSWTANPTFGGGSAAHPDFGETASALETTPAAGDHEYDGNAFYTTPNAGNRGVSPSQMFLSISANQTGTNVNTAQPWFAGGGATGITLPGNTTYFFKGHLSLSRTAGATSHTTAILFGGTATVTSINWTNIVESTAGSSTSTLQAVNSIEGSSLSGATVTAAVANASEWLTLEVSGIIRVNAGGTLIPQFQYSVAPGGAPTIQANSYFLLWPVGAGSILSVGNWQ